MKRFLEHDPAVRFDTPAGRHGPVTASCVRCGASATAARGEPDALYAALAALDERPCALAGLDAAGYPRAA